MTATAKLENLTHSWYGFAVFTAVWSILTNGFGLFRLVYTAAALAFSVFVTFLLGRALLNRSGLVRMVLVVLSALGTAFGVLGIVTRIFMSSWSFGLLATLVLAAAGVYMNFRSLRVLTDNSVKVYFG